MALSLGAVCCKLVPRCASRWQEPLSSASLMGWQWQVRLERAALLWAPCFWFPVSVSIRFVTPYRQTRALRVVSGVLVAVPFTVPPESAYCVHER
jgi:hypothetical protein